MELYTVALCTSGFEQPRDFIPERWVDDKGWVDDKEAPPTVAQEPWHFESSAGKRACDGYRLASKEISMALALILQCFHITACGAVDTTKLKAFNLGEPFPVQLTLRDSGSGVVLSSCGTRLGARRVVHSAIYKFKA